MCTWSSDGRDPNQVDTSCSTYGAAREHNEQGFRKLSLPLPSHNGACPASEGATKAPSLTPSSQQYEDHCPTFLICGCSCSVAYPTVFKRRRSFSAHLLRPIYQGLLLKCIYIRRRWCCWGRLRRLRRSVLRRGLRRWLRCRARLSRYTRAAAHLCIMSNVSLQDVKKIKSIPTSNPTLREEKLRLRVRAIVS